MGLLKFCDQWYAGENGASIDPSPSSTSAGDNNSTITHLLINQISIYWISRAVLLATCFPFSVNKNLWFLRLKIANMHPEICSCKNPNLIPRNAAEKREYIFRSYKFQSTQKVSDKLSCKNVSFPPFGSHLYPWQAIKYIT